MFDLSALNVQELADLKKRIDVEVVNRKQADRQRLRAEMQRLAAEAGMSLEDILGKAGKKTVKVVVPVHVNPADPSQTWSGRGRKPAWVVEALAGGMGLEQLKI